MNEINLKAYSKSPKNFTFIPITVFLNFIRSYQNIQTKFYNKNAHHSVPYNIQKKWKVT